MKQHFFVYYIVGYFIIFLIAFDQAHALSFNIQKSDNNNTTYNTRSSGGHLSRQYKIAITSYEVIDAPKPYYSILLVDEAEKKKGFFSKKKENVHKRKIERIVKDAVSEDLHIISLLNGEEPSFSLINYYPDDENPKRKRNYPIILEMPVKQYQKEKPLTFDLNLKPDFSSKQKINQIYYPKRQMSKSYYFSLSKAINTFEKLHIWHSKLTDFQDEMIRDIGITFKYSFPNQSFDFNGYCPQWCKVQYVHNHKGHELKSYLRINALGGAFVFKPDDLKTSKKMIVFFQKINKLVEAHVAKVTKQYNKQEKIRKQKLTKQKQIDKIFN